MKTIFVDAVDCFVSPDGVIFKEMFDLLESYPNKKILLTGANDEQFKKFGLDKMPYEVFTLKHDPEKTNPEYFRILLKHFDLDSRLFFYFGGDFVDKGRDFGGGGAGLGTDDEGLVFVEKYFGSFERG